MNPQEVADRLAIHDVLVRYFIAIDRRDWELTKSCFTPDVYCAYHGFELQGAQKLVDQIRGLERLRVSMHFMGNYRIEVNGDKASSECYCEAHLINPTVNPQQEHDHINGLRYVDQFVRVKGEWKIRHRVQYRDWNREEVIMVRPPRTNTPRPA